MAVSFDDFLSDSFERARSKKEPYTIALISNLRILKPNLARQVPPKVLTDMSNYNPRAWNDFLEFTHFNWYA